MKRLKTASFVLALGLGMSWWVWAQQPTTSPPIPSAPNMGQPAEPPLLPNMEPSKPILDDPTTPNQKLKDALNKPAQGVPQAGAPRMPSVSVRARVIARGQSPRAYLDVDGKLYAVTLHSIIPLGGGASLRVVELSSAEVRLELLPLKEMILVP